MSSTSQKSLSLQKPSAETWWTCAKNLARAIATWLKCGVALVRLLQLCHLYYQSFREGSVCLSCLSMEKLENRVSIRETVLSIQSSFVASSKVFFFLIFILTTLGPSATRGIFSCGIPALGCGMWDLAPWPRKQSGPPALYWEHGVTAVEPPGKFLQSPLLFSFSAAHHRHYSIKGQRISSWYMGWKLLEVLG